MSVHHKSIYVSLANTHIVMGAYYRWVSARYAAGVYSGPDAGGEIGKSLLILIGAGIAVQIIGMILFNILQAIVTGNANRRNAANHHRHRKRQIRTLAGAGICNFRGV